MLKILVFSRTPWRTDNSFGNTYSNWFSKMDGVEVAHICLADGVFNKEVNVNRYFQVSEKALTKSIFTRKKVGNTTSALLQVLKNEKKDKSFFGKLVGYCKKHRLSLFFLLRELIWKYGKVNYDGMKSFIKDFNPDIVFFPMYYAGYVDRIAIKALDGMNVPIVLEAAIDVYSLKQISYDPFFWINRFYVRHKTRQIIKKAHLLYVISDKQKSDYGQFFKLPIKVMYKFPDMERLKFNYETSERQLRYLYTGNLGLGRWRPLSILAKALKTTGGGVLDIYSATELSDYQKSLLNIEGVSKLHGPITSKQVVEEQNNADILVHVESFNQKTKLSVRYSISTKIMDYISVGRCILAIGPSDVASMEYLSNNDLAVLANCEREVITQIQNLNYNRNIIERIAKNNILFTQSSLNERNQRKQFKMDLEEVVSNTHQYKTTIS